MPASKQMSEGARAERKAFRLYLRRRLNSITADGAVTKGNDLDTLDTVLDWVEGRQSRYDKAAGGLGRK